MILGMIILLGGEVFGALSFIFEEKFTSDFDDVDPLIVIGWEGIWGTCIMTTILVFMQGVSING
jgi:hypothetical protein